jgi:hypothetical protein
VIFSNFFINFVSLCACTMYIKSIYMHNIKVSSSDIYNKDKKCDDVRSILKRNITVFILVQTLSNNNSPTFSLAVLCCKI